MIGMTPTEFQNVLEFIQKHHKFVLWKSDEQAAETRKMFPQFTRSMAQHGFGIKYVDGTYDSRDGTIWYVTIRGNGRDFVFATNTFVMALGDNIPKKLQGKSFYEWVMMFLKNELSEKELKHFYKEKK